MALSGLVASGVVVFGALSPPEHCPSVTPSRLQSAAAATVDWFVRNQDPAGTWLYSYTAETDEAAPEYNVVRHAGVTMGLYQAARADLPGSLDSADRGLAWALDRLLERSGWSALTYGGETSTGATALLAAGLADRRMETGDGRYDDLLARLGRFLVAQTEPSGAVLAYYDAATAGPVAGVYSKYYTGETYWAVARLHRLFPDGPWGEVADRIGAYVAGSRDEVEDFWPPLADHWAAYGLAETVAFDDRPDTRPLTDDELAYARRQAGLFGSQVRWVSQRFGPWGRLVRGAHVPRGGGYGVVGEALTGLWRVAQADARLAELRRPIAERAICMAGLAMNAQADSTEARQFDEPDRVEGAWFRDGTTRMDDQQHALAALLRTITIVEEAEGARGDQGPSTPSVWLWLVALVATFNPFLVALAVPRSDGSPRSAATLAAFGGAGGSLIVLAAALAGSWLLGAAEVSEPSVRVAAGAVAAITGVATLLRKPPSAEPALQGWRAAFVPVGLPLVAGPGLTMLALSAHADRGLGLLVGALAIGTVTVALVAAVTPGNGVGRHVVIWGGRMAVALSVAVSVLLLIDGVLDV